MTTIEAIASKRLTAREKVARDDLIVEARLRGRSWPRIAAEFDLTERQCQSILAEWRKANPSARHTDALELVDDLLEALQGIEEELAEVAASTAHDGVRLGAVRSRINVLGERANILSLVGVLPNLSTLRQEINARQTADRIMAVLNEHEVGDEIIAAMYFALTGEHFSVPLALDDVDDD